MPKLEIKNSIIQYSIRLSGMRLRSPRLYSIVGQLVKWRGGGVCRGRKIKTFSKRILLRSRSMMYELVNCIGQVEILGIVIVRGAYEERNKCCDCFIISCVGVGVRNWAQLDQQRQKQGQRAGGTERERERGRLNVRKVAFLRFSRVPSDPESRS